MRSFLRGFAYFLIYTTPIQLGLVLWLIWLGFATDYTFLTLTGHVFWVEFLTPITFLYNWIYSWFWNAYLDFWFGMPAAVPITLKLLFNTWVAIWLLKFTRNMQGSKGSE